MKKTFLMVATIATLPIAAHAGLQVSATDADLGKKCYSDQSSGTPYRMYAVHAPTGHFTDQSVAFDPCADTYAEQLRNNDTHCTIGLVNGTLYHCLISVYPAPCDIVDSWETGSTEQDLDWTADGDNRVYKCTLETNYTEQDDYNCEITYDCYDTEYGCAAGYWSSGYLTGVTNPKITCGKCPTSGGIAGHSAIGNTSITGCYIPSGSNFSDSYGSGVLTGDCYYKQ